MHDVCDVANDAGHLMHYVGDLARDVDDLAHDIGDLMHHVNDVLRDASDLGDGVRDFEREVGDPIQTNPVGRPPMPAASSASRFAGAGRLALFQFCNAY